jgi:hypothetical protein
MFSQQMELKGNPAVKLKASEFVVGQGKRSFL